MDALILAGGENRRMPFLKGFLEVNGKRIIETNTELLRGIFPRVFISTNDPELYFSLGSPMIGDIVRYRGPMTGIYSALSLPDIDEVFVTACDMPFINVILIQHIINLWDKRRDAVIPLFEDKPQPLFGVYAKSGIDTMGDSIKKGKRSLRALLKRMNVLYVDEEEVRKIDSEGRSFININTPEDLERERGKVCLV
jgi:molybdopterin-guanine dinucleotide biosynthesis protein A